jgi:SAM-dependent methyltransferase
LRKPGPEAMGRGEGRHRSRPAPAEIEHLRAQLALSWDEERKILDRLGIDGSARVLEIGSGPGFVTERLLEWLPGARITAVEIRPEMASEARARAGGDRVRIVERSICQSGLESNSFDFALARYVFRHLEDPIAAARATYGLLRPGGVLAIIDVDAGFPTITEPYWPELYPIYLRAGRVRTQPREDRAAGRKLYRYLVAAGFESPRIEAFVCHSDDLRLERFAHQLTPARLQPAVDQRLITPLEYERLASAFTAFQQSSDAFAMMVGFVAHAARST